MTYSIVVYEPGYSPEDDATEVETIAEARSYVLKYIDDARSDARAVNTIDRLLRPTEPIDEEAWETMRRHAQSLSGNGAVLDLPDGYMIGVTKI